METASKIKVKVEYEIPTQDIADILCNAFEGGSNYWYKDLDHSIVYNSYLEWFDDLPRLIEEGGVNADGEKEPLFYITDKTTGKRHSIYIDDLLQGIEKMSKTYHREGLFNILQADAETGDVLLQFTVLGDILYG